MSALRRWWGVLAILLVAFLPLAPAAIRGHTIGPFDQIRQMAPWDSSVPEQPWDVLQADGVLQFYAWRDLVFEAWNRHELPLWNPYQLAGSPLLTNSQSAGLYPPHILIGLLGIGTSLGVLLLAWIHLAWAGLGTAMLARRLGASQLGSVISGIAFATSSFMLAWVALPSVITTCSWIPWCLAQVVWLAEAGVWRDRFRRSATLALALAMMILAGHLQFAAYGMMAVALLAIWAVLRTRATQQEERAVLRLGRFAGSMLLAVCLGVAMAAPHLFPVLRASESSHRRNVPSEEGYQAYVASALKPFELAKLVEPNLLGVPWQRAADDVPVSTYLPALMNRGANYAEGAVSVGPAIVLLLLGACLKWRQFPALRPLSLLAVLAGLLAFGAPLNRLLYFFLPGWSSTGSPGRIAVLAVLALCVSASFGVDALREKGRPTRGSNLDGLLCFGSFLVAIGFATMTLGAASSDLKPIADAIHLRWLVAAASVALVLLWRFIGSSRKWGFHALPAVVICVALLGGMLQVVPHGRPLARLDTPVAKYERVSFINDNWELLVAARALMPPNTATAMRVHDIAGYDSMLHRDTVQLLKDISRQDAAPPANGNIMFVKPTVAPDRLREAGVTKVFSLRELSELGTPTGRWGAAFAYALGGPGRVSLAGGRAAIVRESSDGLSVEVSGPGRLTLRDRGLPGWSAWAGERNLKIVGGRWLEVEVPPGVLQIDFRYEPPMLRLGLQVGLVAWVIGFCALWIPRAAKPIG